MSDRLTRLNEVFQQVFEDDQLMISRTMTAEDVEGWDSLMHVNLLVNIEKVFGIKFKTSDVARLTNVGELVDLIDTLLESS